MYQLSPNNRNKIVLSESDKICLYDLYYKKKQLERKMEYYKPKTAKVPAAIKRSPYSYKIGSTNSSDEHPFRRMVYAQSAVWEFGGNLGSICLMIIMPTFVFYSLLCKTNKCSIQSTRELTVELLNIDKMIFCAKVIGALLLTQLIIHGFQKFGQSHKNKYDPRIVYCFNGKFAVLITFVMTVLLDSLQLLKYGDIMNAYFGMATTSYLFAIVFSIFLHFKSHKKVPIKLLNVYAESQHKIYNYWRGKEMLPYVANINLRMVLSRYSIVATIIQLLFHLKYAIKFEIQNNEPNFLEIYDGIFIQPTIVFIGLMQLFYVGYILINEKEMVNTFEWNYDGVGYNELVKYFLYPFYYVSLTKYAVDNGVVFWTPIIIFLLILYIIGFTYKIYYNAFVPDFKINPLHPDLPADVVSDYVYAKKNAKPVPKGIRQPSHLGDFIINICFGFTGLFMLSLGMFPAVFSALAIIHRAWRIDRKCLVVYKMSWNIYCKLYPKIMFTERF